MKTNVAIEMTDEQREALANLIDGKTSKRKATRAEVVAICQQHIAGLLTSTDKSFCLGAKLNDLYTVDPEDRAVMAQPDNPGYVRGWNTVKRSRKLTA